MCSTPDGVIENQTFVSQSPMTADCRAQRLTASSKTKRRGAPDWCWLLFGAQRLTASSKTKQAAVHSKAEANQGAQRLTASSKTKPLVTVFRVTPGPTCSTPDGVIENQTR